MFRKKGWICGGTLMYIQSVYNSSQTPATFAGGECTFPIAHFQLHVSKPPNGNVSSFLVCFWQPLHPCQPRNKALKGA